MKIILLASFADSMIPFRGDLMKELVIQGNEVIACAPHMSNGLRFELKSLGVLPEEVELARTGLSPLKDLIYFHSVYKIIKNHSPDLILTYTVKPNIWGALAARACNVKSISMVTGLGFAFIDRDSARQKLIGWLVKTLYRMSTRANCMVIFQNKDDSRDFIEQGCLQDSSKVRHVRGSGVNTSFYSSVELPPKPIFLLIARFLFNKGIIEYAEAATIVREKYPDARFLIAGFLDKGQDGLSESDLDHIINMGLEHLGELKDVRDAIASASVYVLPSYREGTPRSVLEAMSMGRPIITTDAPGCRETTIDGVNGFLVPVRDVNILADKMCVLASSDSLRTKLGKASRELAEDRFSAEKVNATLIEYILAAVNSK